MDYRGGAGPVKEVMATGMGTQPNSGAAACSSAATARGRDPTPRYVAWSSTPTPRYVAWGPTPASRYGEISSEY